MAPAETAAAPTRNSPSVLRIVEGMLAVLVRVI
jgi:hypothetical protein